MHKRNEKVGRKFYLNTVGTDVGETFISPLLHIISQPLHIHIKATPARLPSVLNLTFSCLYRVVLSSLAFPFATREEGS